MTEQKTLVLAFDIERSGGAMQHQTIGIGASVVDHNLQEVDNLFLPAYVPGETIFESRCYQEFWSKHLDKLELLKYTGKLDPAQREEEMITAFQEFRHKWETFAKDNDYQFELVADNNVYDGGFINNLIGTYLSSNMAGVSQDPENKEKFYTPLELPIPYSASHDQDTLQQTYKAFWETHSEQRGLLMVVDPSFKKNWGYSQRIQELYDVPSPKKPHDHNPANDAYTIAYEQQVLLGIRDGRIQRRKND